MTKSKSPTIKDKVYRLFRQENPSTISVKATPQSEYNTKQPSYLNTTTKSSNFSPNKKQPVRQDVTKIIRSESKQSLNSCKSEIGKEKSDYKEKAREEQAIACANVLMIDFFNR